MRDNRGVITLTRAKHLVSKLTPGFMPSIPGRKLIITEGQDKVILQQDADSYWLNRSTQLLPNHTVEVK